MSTAIKERIGEDEEDILRVHTVEIEEVLEAKDVTPFLYAKGIIDRGDLQEIEMPHTRIERAKRLLHTIIYRGKFAFPIFIDSLRKNGYLALADLLDKGRVPSKNNEGGKIEELEKDLQILKKRIDHLNEHIAQDGVTKSDIEGMKTEYVTITSTLNELKRISTVHRDTVATLVDLQKQLKVKDEELADAKNRIAELANKVENLERENNLLRGEMEIHRQRVAKLETSKRETDSKIDGLARIIENQDKKHLVAMAKVERSVAALSERQKPITVGLKGHAITPRHRFQKEH